MAEGMQELSQVANQLTPWEFHVAKIITEIPSARLLTYGCLARLAAERYGYKENAARAVANLRNKLYGLLGHDTTLPLHRIATQGDRHSRKDSAITKSYNDRLRAREGTLDLPDPWWHPCKD